MHTAEQIALNLARKWRPRQFDQIIGQDLSVRMLKNSLYLDQLFPVYVFSGERGCGKTTTARIFAAAINCSKTPQFRQQPQGVVLPCLTCSSCLAMQAGSHPDFIEIDAASHTGVDHVRQMLESAQHLPLGDGKKIYLIDEVHMLSKAAFNAFLKMLEEPPATVIFMLATTELEKIPDTVRSRTFQLFFDAIAVEKLRAHIADIAQHEGIEITPEIATLIAREGRGSVRDAINVLERVRFLDSPLTIEVVRKALGVVDESVLLGVVDAVMSEDLSALFAQLDVLRRAFHDPHVCFTMLVQAFHTLLQLKHKSSLSEFFSVDYIEALRSRAQEYPVRGLIAVQQLFWEHEVDFLRSPNKQLMIEHLLIMAHGARDAALRPVQAMQKVSAQASVGNVAPRQVQRPPEASAQPPMQRVALAPTPVVQSSIAQPVSSDARWINFLDEIRGLGDPLLLSIFSQARFVAIDQAAGTVSLEVAQQSRFFEQTINDRKDVLSKIVSAVFDGASWFTFASVQQQGKPGSPKAVASSKPPVQEPIKQAASPQVVGVSSDQEWPLTARVTKYFPGTVQKIEKKKE